MRHAAEVAVSLHGLSVTEIAAAGRREGYRLALAKLAEFEHSRIPPLDVLAQFDAWLKEQAEGAS